jgi:hypothetical protein
MSPCKHQGPRVFAALLCTFLTACAVPVSHDVILRGGTIYDGSGGESYIGDVAFDGDVISALGDLEDARAKVDINVRGLAVAPGFVNMMSWANESLIEDGRSQSDIRQGVTLEVMGEGNSMGPLLRNTWSTWSNAVSRPMLPRSSALPPPALMSLGRKTARPLTRSSNKCVPWCVRPWKMVRSAWPHP